MIEGGLELVKGSDVAADEFYAEIWLAGRQIISIESGTDGNVKLRVLCDFDVSGKEDIIRFSDLLSEGVEWVSE